MWMSEYNAKDEYPSSNNNEDYTAHASRGNNSLFPIQSTFTHPKPDSTNRLANPRADSYSLASNRDPYTDAARLSHTTRPCEGRCSRNYKTAAGIFYLPASLL